MFWDSSALVPVLLPEPRSADVGVLLAGDRGTTIWWATPVECLSAVYRYQRGAELRQGQLGPVLRRLEMLAEDVHTVPATDGVRARAGRLLAVHALRAADALQLAAALVWCEGQPAGQAFVCLDARLRRAALLEGFLILPD